MRFILALLLFTTPALADRGPYPINFKSLVASVVKTVFKDPYSIRDARISYPLRNTGPNYGDIWSVCVEANAKNSYGGYSGIRAVWFVIVNKRIVNYEGGSEVSCNYSPSDYYSMMPFPEITSLVK